METIAETIQLSKHFGSVIALDKLDLKIHEGVVALIGPNGAGKTTLIKLFLGLLQPTEGNAYLLGLNTQKESLKIRQKIGILHEKPWFPTSFSPQRFLQYLGKLFKLDAIDDRINESLRAVNLGDVRNRKIGTLSAGMTQRLGLAQALLVKPSLIILDEPTANLDPLGRLRVLGLIRKFNSEYNISFIISSHILLDLERVSDQVVIIDQGKLIISGELSTLLRQEAISLITIRAFDDRLEGAVKNMRSVKEVERVDRATLDCHVEDVANFEIELFKWAIEKGARIEVLKVQNTLEKLYARAISLGGENQ